MSVWKLCEYFFKRSNNNIFFDVKQKERKIKKQ